MWSKKQTIIIIILLIFTAATSWTALLLYSSSSSSRKLSPNHPDAFIEQARIIQTNDDGTHKNRLISPKMTHYPANNTTDMDTPHFTFYSKENPPWETWSKYGQARDGSDVIYLWNHVKIQQSASNTTQETTMLTNDLTIYPAKDLAITHEPVSIVRDDSKVNSIGTRVNLKNGTAYFPQQFNAVYYPAKDKKNKDKNNAEKK